MRTVTFEQKDILAALVQETDEERREQLEELASFGDFQIVVKDEE